MNQQSLSLRFDEEQMEILDQQLLPFTEAWVHVESPDHMVMIIKDLKVRGAPLIGVAAGLSLGQWAWKAKPSVEDFRAQAERLRESRPTAVNLMMAMDRLLKTFNETENYEFVWKEAMALYDEDQKLTEMMSQKGAELIEDGDSILTHCNTGGLATVGQGTALGVIRAAHEQGKKIHVYVDETRPLLQGGRLTTWELNQLSIPQTLICDNMAGALMAQGKIQKAFVGADRIALNGDFANKIGTYSVAVLCQYHKIPFYGVAPVTTVDFECETGRDIPVEQRKDSEVRGVFGSFGDVTWAPDVNVENPAFDVTPSDLVTGLVIDNNYFDQASLKEGVIAKLQK